jgi:hypothetical protein
MINDGKKETKVRGTRKKSIITRKNWKIKRNRKLMVKQRRKAEQEIVK